MNTFWKYAQNACGIVGAITIGYFFLAGLFGRVPAEESFNPNKMSQVPKVWPTPAWAAPQGQPARVRHVEIRLPSWDEGWEPYDVWLARQPCVPNRPH